MRFSILFSLFIALIFQSNLLAQTARVVGVISDSTSGENMVSVGIGIKIDGKIVSSASSDFDGRYDIKVPANKRFELIFSFTGYKTLLKPLRLKDDETYRLNIRMMSTDSKVPEVIVESFSDKEADALRINRDDIQNIPTTTMNLESMLLFTAVGVANRSELSSQYSVRGGNYDENLVYVNGFEIYRPLLIRSGQQEGLTFPNPDMLEELSFSSGGFKAQYGDKMASVLDVRYRRPTSVIPEVRIQGSLLGASAYVGGAVSPGENTFTYTIGARYKTTKYLLDSRDLRGEYIPNFADFQADLIYDISNSLQVEVIGNYNSSEFQLIPEEAASTTGLFNQALRLSSLFEGQEISSFRTYTVGTALAYLQPLNSKVDSAKGTTTETSYRHRILFSNYQSDEDERIDIQNFYRLEEVETGLGEDNFGEVIGTLAYGETHLFARNFLKANVTQARYVGAYSHELFNDKKGYESKNFLKWGLTYKYEMIDDELKEWTRFDSLGYTLPYDTVSIPIFEYIETDTNFSSHRLAAFVQNTWEYNDHEKHFLRATVGVRAQYWTLNQELVFSPRGQIYYSPLRFHNSMADSLHRTKDLTFKLAIGAYHQPPFYRELRDLQGNVSTDVLAQKSLHFVGGVVWDFVMFERKFKFISETYYKHQWDLIPYDVENVRIRYYGDNIASGYVTGLDMRLNGELVPGLESWVNMSLLRARERFDTAQHKIYRLVGVDVDTILTPDVPKPTDQFLIFSMYFQDYFPKAEWFKVNLAFTVGTGMPFGIPRDNITARNLYRYTPYHRIDIGFSFGLWNRKNHIEKRLQNENMSYDEAKAIFQKGNHKLKFLKSAWLSLEVFNLMGVANVATNTWIKDFTNTSYAIPNYLTSRRVNVRLRFDF
jgi:hypothetical protein